MLRSFDTRHKMPRIKLITIGKVKERYIQDGINEFLKRLTPFCKLEILELKDEGIEKESKKLEKYIGQNTFILHEKGKQFSSEEFSGFLKNKSQSEIIFIIGGHDGISEKIKQKNSGRLISMARMTFTHEMARLFLVEQIYRGFMILNGRKYHK